ncbi:helix-turn-helix transcriptional regulator [Acidovorax sp. BL-A-41-H1]|uniref:helix-turn-helix transcriptional regulator n=1 Tax=Acidovorax sp. BL-A-41-H1 TaxID=3421102 RepID=UPI003F79C90D
MRQWQPSCTPASAQAGAAAGRAGQALASMVLRLGEPGFAGGLLQDLAPVLPAASWSVYRTGQRCKPTLFMSASHGVPDTTQDCWWAYLSGPYRKDRTWGRTFDEAPTQPLTQLCHVTAHEVEGEHRARVYEAHGVAERVSVADYEDDGSVFAVNFYRHQHQRAFRDSDICGFEEVAPVLLALARKHIALAHPLAGARAAASAHPPLPARGQTLPSYLPELRERLLRTQHDLTERELDVCARLLQGMTHEGIASDLGVGVPTVKTYRNRAFARMGIHFRNELFARVLGQQG